MSDTRLHIYSHRMGITYLVQRFSEYKLDIDLDTDSDGFNMVFENPNGVYTGYFNKFDKVDLLINDVGVLKGTIDNVRYRVGDSQNIMQIVGRDIASTFVDNEAIPATINNVRPDKYITEKCKYYGISNYVLDKSAPLTQKLMIGTGESEISVMKNLLMEDNDSRRIWIIYDTMYMGKWNTEAKASYYFTRGVPSNMSGIPIKTLDLLDDGTDMKSEVRIYGSVSDGTEKVMGTAKNDYLISRDIKKRQILRSYNNDSSSRYASNALKTVRDSFQSGIVLEITIKTPDDIVILPNRTAQVIDTDTQINSTFFIRSVSYNKSIGSGGTTTITMIPGEETFNVIWNNQSSVSSGYITGVTRSLSDLLKSRK